MNNVDDKNSRTDTHDTDPAPPPCYVNGCHFPAEVSFINLGWNMCPHHALVQLNCDKGALEDPIIADRGEFAFPLGTHRQG